MRFHGNNQQQIRTQTQPYCTLCGSRGEPLYFEQQDRLFGVKGSWSLAKCSGRLCGLIWMSPMPLKEDIGKAYVTYYTHASRNEASQADGILKQLYQRVKRGYLAGKYGYHTNPKSTLFETLGKILYLFPLRRTGVDEDVRGLPALPQGLLLDVGCGSGDWLITMRELGWKVEGVDFDENAVKAAMLKGLKVHCGTLEAQNFPDEYFDAITLNHVIEHVSDPVATLIECHRILKKDGRLILYTPNSASFGHHVFKEHWRGLEPPRHLHLFSPNSVKGLLLLAGFPASCVKTVNSGYLWMHSFGLYMGEIEPGLRSSFWIKLVTKIVSYLFTLLEQGMLIYKPDIGECLAVQAVKTVDAHKDH